MIKKKQPKEFTLIQSYKKKIENLSYHKETHSADRLHVRDVTLLS